MVWCFLDFVVDFIKNKSPKRERISRFGTIIKNYRGATQIDFFQVHFFSRTDIRSTFLRAQYPSIATDEEYFAFVSHKTKNISARSFALISPFLSPSASQFHRLRLSECQTFCKSTPLNHRFKLDFSYIIIFIDISQVNER